MSAEPELVPATAQTGPLPGAHTVVVAAPDGVGRIMGKSVRVADWPTVRRDGMAMPDFHLATDVTNAITPGLAVTGEHTGFPNGVLRPDETTLRHLPWLPGVAIVLADVEAADGCRVPEAPRTVLAEQVRRLRRAGLEASTATELELYVFREPYNAAARADYAGLSPLHHRAGDHDVLVAEQYESFLTPLREVMAALGTPVISTLGEGGAGQIEVNFGHGPPVATADAHVLFKFAAKALAARLGHSATFMAKWHHDQPGSSGHIHLSLHDVDTRAAVFDHASSPERLEDRARSFLAGVLTYAPDFALLHAPYANSFRRLRSGHWVPERACWGVDDRRALIRLLGRGDSGRFEFRYPGADMNPYLSLAALLAAGLAGYESGLPLAARGQEAAGMPADLREAIDCFARSDVARLAFGERVHDHLLRRAQHELHQTERLVADWERQRAFEAG